MNPTSDRTNVTDTGYTFGGKDYQKETRLDAFNNPYTVDVVKGSAPAFNTVPNVSTTTVSNENKKKQAANMLSTVNQMTESRGQKSDGVSVKNPDGTLVTDNYQEPTLPMNASPIYGTVNGVANRIIGYNQSDLKTGSQTPTYFDSNSSTPAQSPEDQQMNAILDQIKATTDANTARQVSAIQQRFEMLRQQQKQINAGQEAGIKNALLMGGVTGKGSSSQYAPISSEGIVTAQLNYGVQQLAELDSKEQDLINEAQRAGESQNFQILEKKLAMIEKTKAAKDEVAKKLNEKIAEQTAKAREAMIQSTRDNALADLFAQGVTDPGELLKALNANGGDFTLKEIHDGLGNIAKSVGTETKGMTADAKEFFALREQGEIPQSILKLETDSEQLNAYLRNKAIARKVPAAIKTSTTKSGTLTYSKEDQAEDSKALEISRGADGYVDPTLYEKLYKSWVNNGGLLKDFLAKFPPKNYVNPENDWLPIFLRPTVVKSKTKSTVDEL